MKQIIKSTALGLAATSFLVGEFSRSPAFAKTNVPIKPNGIGVYSINVTSQNGSTWTTVGRKKPVLICHRRFELSLRTVLLSFGSGWTIYRNLPKESGSTVACLKNILAGTIQIYQSQTVSRPNAKKPVKDMKKANNQRQTADKRIKIFALPGAKKLGSQRAPASPQNSDPRL